MEDNKRACFALIAASLVNKTQYNNVHDLQRARSIVVSTTDCRNFFDHNRCGAISGSANDMFDHVTGTHVSVNVSGNIVNCFDNESATPISFTVNGSNVSSFDNETGRNYNYNVN